MPTDPILLAFDERRRRGADLIVVARRHQASVDDVERMARAAGRQLERAALAAGSVVGLLASNGPGFLAALVALRRAACAALLFDARTPPAAGERAAEALGAAATLTCRRAWPHEEDDFCVAPVAAGVAAVLPPEIAVVKLTSGSTGEPRGILTPSAALVADDAALAATMGLAEDERILAAIPLSHSYGLSSVALPALMRRTVLIVPETRDPLDPMRLAREQEATFLPTVPAYLQGLVRMAAPPRPPASLRLVVSAGAPRKPCAAARFRELYERPVHVFYGASECGGITFDRDGSAGEHGTLGRSVAGVDVALEPETDGGERGTVVVASAAVAAGYFPTPDPRLDGGRFRTSDVGRWLGGELVLEGRLDDLINVRGKKVNPREIDAVLARLEGVDEVVTLGVTLPGQDGMIVRSFVACRPGRLSYETVHAWCRRHLAEHKVPRSIVLLAEIPRTARGKLDRGALLAIETHGRPIPSGV